MLYIYTHIYMCMHVCAYTHTHMHTQNSENSLLRVASFLPLCGPGVWTQAIRLGDKQFGFEPPHQVLNILITQFSLCKFIFPIPPHPLLLGTGLRIFTLLGKPSITLQANLSQMSFVSLGSDLTTHFTLVSLEDCSTFHSARGP